MDGKGEVVDEARSYAGLRSVAIDGKAITLNGRPVFQRLVLDQGYYPDGIMTAPSDEALRRDIELSKEAGFNGRGCIRRSLRRDFCIMPTVWGI